MEKAASPLRNRRTRKQHIISGLLNLSSIKGEAIYFASPHTSARPRTYVLVTGGGSNGEPNCLGKKINKQHDELIHRKTLMAGVSGPERFPEAAQRICTFMQRRRSTPALPNPSNHGGEGISRELPFMVSSGFSVRWASCHVSEISVRTAFNRTSTQIFMLRRAAGAGGVLSPSCRREIWCLSPPYLMRNTGKQMVH